MITYSDFVIDFPEFANPTRYPQERVERAIVRASNQIDNELDLAPELISYLAAHLLSITTTGLAGGAGTGAIGSVSVSGEYTVSYSGQSFAGSGSALDATPYGKEFQRLLSSISISPVVAYVGI